MASKRYLIILGVAATVGVLSHLYLRGHSRLYNWIITPSDYSASRGSASIDISLMGNTAELRFSLQYPGNHVLALVVERPAAASVEAVKSLRLKTEIYKGGTLISTERTEAPEMWLSDGPRQSELWMQLYRAPTQLPIGEELVAKVSVENPVEGFSSINGQQRIVIEKISDE